MPDGNYQSCGTCEGYVACYSGSLSYRPCPDDLVWDDEEKHCGPESTTCNIPSAIHSLSAHATPMNNKCVSDCNGMPQGDYQSCKTCGGYVTCANGHYYDMPCPADYVWDDRKKRCSWESKTCACVSDCSGLPSGDYQSCKTCAGFVTCANNHYYDLPCHNNYVWDDVKKRCGFESKTCDISSAIYQSATDLTSIDKKCVSDCKGMPDGEYQSCRSCAGYVTCSMGHLYERSCPAGLVWNDEEKRCDFGRLA